MNALPNPKTQLMTQLLTTAAKQPIPPFAATLAEGKLYEVKVLSRLLRRHRVSTGGTVSLAGANVPVMGPPPNFLRLAGGPASANRQKFNFFVLDQPKGPRIEAWVSVQVRTLSARHYEAMHGPNSATGFPAGRHEVDVALFKEGVHGYPRYVKMLAGLSCKATAKCPKAVIRELVGLRRETAYVAGPKTSRVRWLAPRVCADPASPLFLVCAAPKCRTYRKPIGSLGVLIRYMPV